MWSYRDWVIKAFNATCRSTSSRSSNLAGDLLPNATLDQQIGSGFNRCNITTNEGGAIDEEYLVLYTRDRTETTSQVWMGLTAGCAVCHDHKFDPLSQREFYELAAFFNNTTQKAMDGNIKDTPPIVHGAAWTRIVPRWDELAKQIPDAEAAVDERTRRRRGRSSTHGSPTAKPTDVAAQIPTAGLRAARAARRRRRHGRATSCAASRREAPLPATVEWRAGHARRATPPTSTRARCSKSPTPATSNATRRSRTPPG